MCIMLLTGCGDATSISIPSAEQPPQEQPDIMGALQIGATSSPEAIGSSEDAASPGSGDSSEAADSLGDRKSVV